MGIFQNGADFWMNSDPNSQWNTDWRNAGKAADSIATGLGYAPKHVDPNQPGGQLDTSAADADRQRNEQLLAQLRAQAQSGGGAWEQALKNSTGQASSAAMAVGQSNPNVGYAAALRNIGNAQGAVAQRAVGQGNMLRAQSQAGAQDQLSGLLAAQGGTDANQAAASAAAKQGVAELDSTLANKATQQTTKDSTSAGGFMGMLSDGGTVPGKPKVFGDNEKNDTVPAWLSPGEIVIPRSHASPELAAAFVRQVQSGQGRSPDERVRAALGKPQRLAGGGSAGDGSGLSGPNGDSGADQNRLAGAVSVFLPHVGAAMRQTKQSAPSIQNGGLFDTSAYDSNRAAQLQNSDLINQRAMGMGPSVVPQQSQDSTDAAIMAALRGSRGGNAAMAAGMGAQAGAGNAAEMAAREQRGAQSQYGQVIGDQRARDNSFAQAQQQAAFRQTQINAGLDLSQQAAMRQNLAGAGQAAMGASQLKLKEDPSGDSGGQSTDQPFGDSTFDMGADSGEMDGYSADGGFGDTVDGEWRGGEIGKYANGGKVDPREAAFLAAFKKSMRKQ